MVNRPVLRSISRTHTGGIVPPSDANRARIARRFATVEPVFGNLLNKGLDRFTLRWRTKVDGQWKLYCLARNMEKLARNGYAM